MAAAAETTPPVVEVTHMDFAYDASMPTVLHDVSLSVKPGQRVLLVGDNGAGKTTLMRVMAGRHRHKEGACKVFGRESFFDTGLNGMRSYLGSDWGKRTVAFAGYGCALQADIKVRDMMVHLQKAFPERREMLIKLLGVNLDWRMHMVSDGQRRRVQIFLQLLRPVPLLLLDEITTDLDVITRADLLEYLRLESVRTGVTILYATHIFDGLAEWFTHIAFLDEGRILKLCSREECTDFQALVKRGDTAPLLRTVEGWLRAVRTDKLAAAEDAPESKAKEAAPEAEDGGDRSSRYKSSTNGFVAGRMAAYISMTE